MKTYLFWASLIFLLPVLSYAQTDTLVVLERWDTGGYDGRHPTGIIRNNSSVGIYQPVISFTFRDKSGKVVSAAKIYNVLFNVIGQTAIIGRNQFFDYIPPKGRAYFQGWTQVPYETDRSKSDVRLSWDWAQNAIIDTSVSIPTATSTTVANGPYYTQFSGEVVNRSSYPITNVVVMGVAITKDGAVRDFEYESAVDDLIPAGKTSAFSIKFYAVYDNLASIYTAITWEPGSPAPPLPKPKLLGDLDGDGDVDFDDFFIFAQQFGKKQ